MTPILLTSEHRPTTIDIPEGTTYTGFSVALQKAVTAGRITLTSTDPRAHPHLDYRYLTDPWDRERMRSGVRACIELTQSSPLADVLKERISPTDDDLASDDMLDAWLLANVGTQHHSSGTCKMGPASDPMAVVDQRLKVHGLKPSGGGRLDHARCRPSQHQRHDDNDRREGRRVDWGRRMMLKLSPSS